MNKSGNEKKMEAKNVAKALADVPIDNKQERDALRARIRKKYAELETLKVGMSKQVRERFEELRADGPARGVREPSTSNALLNHGPASTRRSLRRAPFLRMSLI